MAGSHEQGIKAAQTNKQRYGMNFYRLIGAMGGKNSTNTGFHLLKDSDPEKHKELSRKGGQVSLGKKRGQYKKRRSNG